ncbi:hypothetical protein TEA_001233 [Camellia sinensis var. sinensis]|uniref:Uncharacterized protein n=1 Tax=Camellia sinensis var. sinensis TaxID=542762 RepID=A0A4S4DHX1_CAMSN|nr:hypothetical protein TEA_001233 [Camellia sinensis var. sinensis]
MRRRTGTSLSKAQFRVLLAILLLLRLHILLSKSNLPYIGLTQLRFNSRVWFYSSLLTLQYGAQPLISKHFVSPVGVGVNNSESEFVVQPFSSAMIHGTLDRYGSGVARTVDLSTQVSEPHKKNLFLQSLYKEGQEKSHMTNGNNSGKHAFHSDIQDKDIVEALENEV